MKKINKKLFVLGLLTVQMTFSCFQGELYAASNTENYAGNQLQQLGVLKGYEDGSLKLDQNIRRSEVATMMVRIRGYADSDAQGSGLNFTDVASSHWAYKNIQNAYKLSIIQGYPDNSFKPESNILYQEVVAMMVNTLGYKEDISGEWPNNYISKAKELGVIPKDSQVSPDKIVTRGEMALIIWDTLLVKVKDVNLLQ
ncbi:MAG: S-layer homology domain-containing protein [Vallitaleaceae bacterium]|nr:S-layer homology domain-containing protein [Vallitaleaceae bacterium]